ncbi:MAG TPA: MobF family relaxase [Candidatus Sulfotelmatobacter sp.]|nr:MobF family relaxase [Candidatus Sulfotelmatobacter sp.]
MLTISKPLTAGQAQSYHQKEFTSTGQSYWAGGQEIKGAWQGRLAEQYGLRGAVGGEEFSRLCQGQHPVTGEQLVRHRASFRYENAAGKTVTTAAHRAGWDATFSAPKSISLTALVGGDERVREAHRESVRLALDELERYTQARIGGDHPARTTGKFIVATFEHDTARPVEGYAAPQLHTHAVIFNMTELENGQTRALQPRSLFASQQFATAVYQSELTYRLARLGYELERGRSGAPEIKGYSQDYLDASSPRSRQIRVHLESLGLKSKESAEIAAHSTRDRKQILSPREALAAHRKLAAEFGHQAARVVAEARVRVRRVEQVNPALAALRAQEAVTFSRDRHFEREAVVDERVLMRDALRRGMGEITYSDVHQNFETRLHRGEFLAAPSTPNPTLRLFTTPETVAAERAVIQQMRIGQGQVAPILSARDATAVTDQHSYLNSQQKTAIKHVLTCRDRVLGIQGAAGVGKTTALDVIRRVAEARAYEVEGFAPTSRAAKQLREAGISAGTLQGFLVRRSTPDPPNEKRLYLVDESSLTSTHHVKEFMHRLGPQDRVVLIGDIRQHQAVEAGKPFEQLQDAGMSTAKLEQIVRQKDPDLKAIVEHFARGEVSSGIQALAKQGRITEIGDAAERIRVIARSFVENSENTLVISPDNASRRQLNDAIRTELQSRGRVGAENHLFRVLIPQQDMTGADRRWVARYNVDDVLRYSRGSKSLGIRAGSYARVLSTNLPENLLTVETKNRRQVTYDPRRLTGVSIYRENEQRFAVGDRLQFVAPDRNIGVANRELGTIEDISPRGDLTIRLEKGRRVELDPSENRHFDHGYAVTSHSAQGLTADRVLINADAKAHPDLVNSRFAYVAVSRAQSDARIYTDDRAAMEARLGTEISKSSALAPSVSLEQGAVRDLAITL